MIVESAIIAAAMSAGEHRPAELDLQLPAEPESVTAARHAARDLARSVGAPEGDVALAVSEAVGNAVLHAFRDPRQEGSITVAARLRGRELEIMVADDGGGMTPNLESPGLGLGIALISKLTKDLKVNSSPGGTTLTMRFDRTPERAPGRHPATPERW